MEAEHDRRVVVAHIAQSVRQIVAAGLEARGYSVVTTSRGEEAIRLMVKDASALLLLSLELDDMEGWAVAEALAERVPAARVVALTADARPATRVRAETAGFDAYFALPITPFELVDRLEDLGLTAAGGAE